MKYKAKLQRNISLFYYLNFFTGLLFNVGIWVAFERRVLTFEQMALFSALSTALQTVLQIPTGALADLIGRRVILFIGWVIIASSYLYLAFATTPLMFLISFCWGGLGMSLVSGADVALIYDSLIVLKKEKEFPKIMAKMKFFYRIAIAIATLSGGLIYATNFRLPYILMSLVSFSSLIFVVFMQEVMLSHEKITLASYISQMKQGFKELNKTTYTRSLVIFYTLVGSITWACTNYFNLPFMTDVGYTPAQLGIIFAIVYILIAICIYGLTTLNILLTRKRLYLAFPICMVISLLPGIVANHLTAPLILFIAMITSSARLTFLDNYANQEFASQYRATALSALNMLVSIFYIVLVTIGGKIQDVYGTKIIFTLLGVITILFVFPSALRLIKQHKNYRETQPVIIPTEEEVVG